MDWTNANVPDLTAALTKAQGEFPRVTKSGKAIVPGNRTHRYAELDEILAAVVPPLAKHGIALMQEITLRNVDGQWWLYCQTVLLHVSSQVVALEPFGMPTTLTPHGIASIETYCRRYSLQPALGVSAEYDDDGQLGQEEVTQGRHNQRDRGRGKQPSPLPDRRPVNPPNNQQQQQRPATQTPPERQQPPQQQQTPPPNSREFTQLIGHIREWKEKFPELFPDSNAIWFLMKPAMESRRITSQSIKQLRDPTVFADLVQPVLDAIEEFEISQREKQRQAATVEVAV